jgi:hypothetical protein
MSHKAVQELVALWQLARLVKALHALRGVSLIVAATTVAELVRGTPASGTYIKNLGRSQMDITNKWAGGRCRLQRSINPFYKY